MGPALHKFATCTPVAFHANESFYTRDTGLICRELQALGKECRVIMPEPAHGDDISTDDLLRVPMEKLRERAFWEGLGIEGVVLYSWGDPRYTSIARAIREAGLRLIIHFDSSGELHEHLLRPKHKLMNRAKDIAVNMLRSKHLEYAHAITCSAPCIQSFRQDFWYGEKIARKCVEFPAPVNSCFRYNGAQKQERIISCGSWHNPVKRAWFMMSAIKMLLMRHPSVQVDICGTRTEQMERWHRLLPSALRARVILHGVVRHEQLSQLCNAACVSLCTSESEGSHGASAEALSCGCSVVCPPRPLLSVVRWYTTRNSGSVASEDTPDAVCEALVAELDRWQKGLRKATDIAAAWQACFQVEALLSHF